MTDLRELREAVSFLKSKHIKILLSLAQTVLEAPDRVEKKKCHKHDTHKAGMVMTSTCEACDYNYVWNACADIANAIIARKDAEIAELKSSVKEWICTSCKTIFSGYPHNSRVRLDCPNCGKTSLAKSDSHAEVCLLRERIKELEQELARVREEKGEGNEI